MKTWSIVLLVAKIGCEMWLAQFEHGEPSHGCVLGADDVPPTWIALS